MTKSISIALCTFNGGRFLRQQLESYATQTVQPLELVVCDDGSTDDTIDIIKQFAATACFPVRLEVNKHRLGVAVNFGEAVRRCTGEVIVLSDQDDIWLPPKLERIGNTFADHPDLGMVFSDAEAIDPSGHSLGYRLWDAVLFSRKEREAARRARLLDVLLRHSVVTGATLGFRSQYTGLILPIPPDSLHDLWISLLIASVSPTGIIDEPLIQYRQHTDQVSGGERILSLADQARLARKQTPELLQDTALRFQAIRNRLAESAFIALPSDAMPRIEEKVLHVTARAKMRVPGTFRPPLIIRELLAGRYYRYSHPWKHPAADLFL